MRIKKIVFSVFLILLVSTFTISVKGATIGTDPSNDITRWFWNSSTNLPDEEPGLSKPEIDIQSLDWNKNSDGNVTIGLTFAGTPKVISNNTFYSVTAIDKASNLSIILWAGGGTGYSSENQGYAYVIYGNVFALGGTQELPQVSGNKVVWTLPRQVNSLNFTSFEYEYVDLNLPDNPDPSWEWSATAWTGTIAYGETFVSKVGEWWRDTYLSNDDSFTSIKSDSNGTSDENGTVSGFELLSLFSVGLISLIYTKKRK